MIYSVLKLLPEKTKQKLNKQQTISSELPEDIPELELGDGLLQTITEKLEMIYSVLKLLPEKTKQKLNKQQTISSISCQQISLSSS